MIYTQLVKNILFFVLTVALAILNIVLIFFATRPWILVMNAVASALCVVAAIVQYRIVISTAKILDAWDNLVKE